MQTFLTRVHFLLSQLDRVNRATEECEKGHAEWTTKDADSIETQTVQSKTQSPNAGHKEFSTWFTALQGRRVLFIIMSRKSHFHIRDFSLWTTCPSLPWAKMHLFHNTFLFIPWEALGAVHRTIIITSCFPALPDTLQVSSAPLSCLICVTTESC